MWTHNWRENDSRLLCTWSMNILVLLLLLLKFFVLKLLLFFFHFYCCCWCYVSCIYSYIWFCVCSCHSCCCCWLWHYSCWNLQFVTITKSFMDIPDSYACDESSVEIDILVEIHVIHLFFWNLRRLFLRRYQYDVITKMELWL